ncbi:MAG: protein kinase [Oscillospiraceae bacterium]|nr:protein kinase [Oscillospiraceae bacterium]
MPAAEKFTVLRSLDMSGKVTLAKDPESGRNYVLKELSDDSVSVYRRISGIPEQENLMRVFEVDGNTAVCGYAKGNTLDELIAGGRVFPAVQIAGIITQLCNAAGQLHLYGVIHRDITPKNIIIGDDLHLTLTDFDIARVYSGYREQDTTIRGTEGFAPPEQYGFRETGFTADIYAIGSILRLLLNNCPDCPPMQEVRLRRCAAKCMRLDPGKRFKSAAAVRRAVSRSRWIFPVFIAAAPALAAFVCAVVFRTVPAAVTGAPTAEHTPESVHTSQAKVITETHTTAAFTATEPQEPGETVSNRTTSTTASIRSPAAEVSESTPTTAPVTSAEPQEPGETVSDSTTSTTTNVRSPAAEVSESTPTTAPVTSAEPQELHRSDMNSPDRISVATVLNEQGYYEDEFDYVFYDDPSVHGVWEYCNSLPEKDIIPGLTAEYIREYDYLGEHMYSALSLGDEGHAEWYSTDGSLIPCPHYWTNGYFICEFTENIAAQEMFVSVIDGEEFLFLRLKTGDFSLRNMAVYFEVYTRG